MDDGTVEAPRRLLWGLRRYAWLLALAIALPLALAVQYSPRLVGDETYTARALVIASDLTIQADQLARLSEAIFNGGEVAETAVERGGLPFDPRGLIPDHARLEPLEDNVLLQVVGQADDPEVAARTANTVADALIDDLNEPGPGVGTFELQAAARPPAEPDPRPSPALVLLVALLGGILVGVGAVGLIVAVRRPILNTREATAAADTRAVGALALPSRATDLDPLRVHGLSALLKRVYPSGAGTQVFVAPRGGERARTAVSALVVRSLARRGPVVYVPGSGEGAETDELRENPRITVSERLVGSLIDEQWAVVVDGPSAAGMDMPQFIPPEAGVILVVQEGTREGAVRQAAGLFLPGELSGVLYVERLGWWRSRRMRAAGPPPRTSTTMGEPSDEPAPQDVGDRRGSVSDLGETAASSAEPPHRRSQPREEGTGP